ncbi:MAG: holo-ACP synthase [Proteobacteria bacterium]|jgi:holo-[acyl-carrier protein] synthase|nr:holo-ACP synthase [Pseudomonadota bacterium]MDA1300599.1 holo-ACP synthase [Pseudomonadota bacterium]
MIRGVGVDIVSTPRIRRAVARWGTRFAARILSLREQSVYVDRLTDPAFLARQFAAKEAVSKALGTGMRLGVHFRTIEVLREPGGAPRVELTGASAHRAGELDISLVWVSIADEKDMAIAQAVADSEA